MKLCIVGLGKMGGNMAERLMAAGHEVVGFDRNPAVRTALAAKGVTAVESLGALAEILEPPRTVWIMVPAGQPVDETIATLAPVLAEGDVLIDGGNSYYQDTLRRGAELQVHGLHLVDVGTSGGIWGLAEGYSLMIGGDAAVVERLAPIFQALAPSATTGWGRVGPGGAGHFVKMIHNGIEYGMMQAFAEGFAILERKEAFGLDLHQISEIWRSGSVVRSWLLDLIARALAEDQTLAGIAPHVADSGEGRWTVREAIDLDVPAPVITLALLERIRSRDTHEYYDRLLAAMRQQFGGHAVRRTLEP